MVNILSKFNNIKSFIFDVDGVFTDGSLLISESGDLMRTMNAKDGFAVKYALEKGYKVIIITGGNSVGVKKRLQGLGVTDIYDSVKDKAELLASMIRDGLVNVEETAYMGDDVPDIEIMTKVAFPCCPFDAIPEVIEVSHYVSPKNGGNGCVRDLIESTLKVQGNWL